VLALPGLFRCAERIPFAFDPSTLSKKIESDRF
jgi:hypothetical protein